MHRNDPGYIITANEIARIKGIHALVENDKRVENARCVEAISRILHTVEKHRL